MSSLLELVWLGFGSRFFGRNGLQCQSILLQTLKKSAFHCCTRWNQSAKNYQNDGDSTYRLFYDTVKGGDYRSREANVYRLAEVSTNIIDQCVAQGVPFAREYGGLLDNRSFGGVRVSRTFYAKGQTGQQLLLGAYSAMSRQINKGKIEMFNRHEMLELVIVDGKARGIIARDLLTGEIERHSAHAVVIASGGYGNVFSYPPTQWVQTLLRHGKFIRKVPSLQILATPRFTDLYSCFWRLPVKTDIDVRIITKRWSYLGAKETGRCRVYKIWQT